MTVHTDQLGPVAVVTIDRPTVRNAIDPPTATDLAAAFTAIADGPARVAVLTGSGDTFCSGFDLSEVAVAAPDYEPDGPPPLGVTRSVPPVPVIAAIEGHAVAGGLELALWCDLRVASDTAIFGVFCRRWGVPLVDGGTVRLPRLVGHGRAMDMVLTGRPVGVEEAHAWGLVDRRVPAGTALAAAITLAEEIAAFPQTCLLTDRSSVLAGWDHDLAEALRREAHAGAVPLREEAASGAHRFMGGAGRHGHGVNLD